MDTKLLYGTILQVIIIGIDKIQMAHGLINQGSWR